MAAAAGFLPRPNPELLRGNMRWLLMARCLRSLAQAVLLVVVPLYIAAAGYSAQEVGSLLSIASVGSIVLVLCVGFASDRFGRKPVLAGIALLAAIGTAVYAQTTAFWVLAAMAGLASVGGGGSAGSGGNWGPFYPAEQPLIAESVAPTNRNSAFALLSVVGVIGAAVGSLLAGVPDVLRTQLHMSVLHSFRPLFWLASAISLLIVLLVLPIREERTRVQRRSSGRLSRESMRVVLKLWVTNSLNGFGWGLLGPFLTYWLAIRFGVSAGALGGLYTVVNLLTVLSYLVSPAVARRLGAVWGVVATRYASVLFLAAMVAAPTFALASAAYVMRLVCASVGMPIRQSFVMGISRAEDRSRVAALGNLPSQGTAAVAPTIGAYLLRAVSVEAPLWMAVVAMLLNTTLYGAFFRGIRPPEEEAKRAAAPEGGRAEPGPVLATVAEPHT